MLRTTKRRLSVHHSQSVSHFTCSTVQPLQKAVDEATGLSKAANTRELLFRMLVVLIWARCASSTPCGGRR